MVHFLSNLSGDAFDMIPGCPSSGQFGRNQWAFSGSSSVVKRHTHTHIHTHHTLTHVLVCSPKALTRAHTPTLKHRCAHPHSRTHTRTRKPWLPSNIWPHIFEVRSCPSSTFAGHVVDLWRLSQAVFVGHCLHSLYHCKSPVSMHRV